MTEPDQYVMPPGYFKHHAQASLERAEAEAERLREALRKIARQADETPMEDGIDAGGVARRALENKLGSSSSRPRS